MSFTYSVKSDIGLDKWLENLNNEKLPPIVKKHTMNIQANAMMNAPVDTGALKNSIVSEPTTQDGRNWSVHDGVEYGIYQELGTSRGVKAKHFLGNACEKEAEPFFNDVKEALK